MTLLPLSGPLILDARGHALIQQPDGAYRFAPLNEGVSLSWKPTPELGGVVLSLGDAMGAVRPMATTLTSAGLRALIADLQSIARQMETDHG